MLRKVVAVLCLLSLVGLSSAFAEGSTMGHLFKKQADNKVPVKVYIKEITNQSGNNQVVTDTFAKELESSLHERRSIKFQVVPTPDESDIQISAAIKSFQYLERGPLKPSIGIGTTLLDAAATATQNYVDMAIDYTVADSKTDKVLWQGSVNEYLKKKMTEAESIPLIYAVVTRTFVWRCFGKANLRDSTSHNIV